jgi:hypothetical protein
MLYLGIDQHARQLTISLRDDSGDVNEARQVDYLFAEFVDYYNTTRWSMVRDNLPPIRDEPDEVTSLKLDQIEVKSHVGGLVKSFERKAA